MTMKMKLKMKNRSQRYEINRPRPRHGHNCTKQKICLSMIWDLENQVFPNPWYNDGYMY